MSTYNIRDLVGTANRELQEIAARESVKIDLLEKRTVRFYRTEGLLAPPTRAGRFAQYTEEHLHRLVAIKRLQAEGRTLDEIRDRLEPPPVGASNREIGVERSTRARFAPAWRRADSNGSGQGSEDWGASAWLRINVDSNTELHLRGASSKRVARMVRALRAALEEEDAARE